MLCIRKRGNAATTIMHDGYKQAMLKFNLISRRTWKKIGCAMSRSLLVSWQRSIPSHYETSINPLSSQKEISCHQNNKPGRFIACQCIIYAIVLRCMNSDCHFIIDPFFPTILTIWKTSIQSLYLTEIYVTYRLLSYLFVSRILDTKNPRSLSSGIIWKATSLIIDKEQLCHFLASVLCHDLSRNP